LNETEKAVLACILEEPQLIHTALGVGITPAHFGSIANAKIYETMEYMARQEMPIDLITLRDALDARGHLSTVGDMGYLSALDLDLPNTDYFASYLDGVRSAGVRRRVISVGKSFTRIPEGTFSTDQLLAEVHKQVQDVVAMTDGSMRVTTGEDAVDSLVEHLAEGWDPGIPSHYDALDVQISGLRPGNLLVIAARPGVGKTTMAINMAHMQMSLDQKTVLFFSLEMSAEEVVTKLLTAETGIPMQKIKVGALSESEWEAIEEARLAIGSFNFFIEDSAGVTLDQLASKAREFDNLHGLDIIYVDYLQLMTGSRGAGNRQEEVAEMSRGLKVLAKDLGIPIVAMCQLNRGVEARPSKRPRLSDLRESGAIEQDADAVVMIYRPGIYKEVDTTNGSTTLIIAKNRHGPSGSVNLAWKPDTQQFLNP
jgi:replicative DNA helicase